MEKIIKAAVERGASDLHIKAGDVFRARINGRLIPLTKQALTPDQTRAIAQRLIANEEDRARLDRITDYDCSWGAPGIGRFRVNILKQRSSFMIVMRVIPFEVPTLERLGLPQRLAQLVEADQGLVLVAGATGAGKSSTMAALVNHLNQHHNRHIVCLESPLEFLHRDLQSSVTQREVGVDTPSWETGLRAALRQDPDVIVLGELRDALTLETAMKAAETGHVLVSSVNTADATTTVARLLSMFAPEEQDVARLRLSESLRAIVAQRLLPRADGTGRVAAVEILTATPEVRGIVLDGTQLGELRHVMAGSQLYGMQTFDQHLASLVHEGLVTTDVAVAAASRPGELAAAFGWKAAPERTLHDVRRDDAAAGEASAGGAVETVPDSAADMTAPLDLE